MLQTIGLALQLIAMQRPKELLSMQPNLFRGKILIPSLCGVLLTFASAAFAADQASPTTGLSLSPSVVRLDSGVSLAKIRQLPPDTLLQTKGGRQVRVDQFVKLTDALGSLKGKQASTQRMDMKFSRPTAVATVQIKPGADLKAIAQMPPGTVLELQRRNGSPVKLTVADLKRLAAFEQRRSGRNLLASRSAAPSRSGPAITINSTSDLKLLKGKPDSTVLESPDHKRITLGELKAAFPATNRAGQK